MPGGWEAESYRSERPGNLVAAEGYPTFAREKEGALFPELTYPVSPRTKPKASGQGGISRMRNVKGGRKKRSPVTVGFLLLQAGFNFWLFRDRSTRFAFDNFCQHVGDGCTVLDYQEESGKPYLPRGSSHALKKGLTNLISLPLLNRMLMSIMRVIARFTDAVLCGPTFFTKSIE